MNKQYCVYIMTDKSNNVFKIGMTPDLKQRVFLHKKPRMDGVTRKSSVDKLVYYEVCETAYQAISREKQIKTGSMQQKIDLVNTINAEWRDLSEEL